MTRRFSPSRLLVVDTNILVRAILGMKLGEALALVSRHRTLIASAGTARELRLVVTRLDAARLGAAEALLGALEVADPSAYAANLDTARFVLLNAPASRNGSISDAHILALAWVYDADIWSHDRDFAGTGWPSWSSANLAAALSEESAVSIARS